jgi:hypothetical protein
VGYIIIRNNPINDLAFTITICDIWGNFGKLIGVQRAQISKLDNNTTKITLDTILRLFRALKANEVFNVELENENIKIAG